MAKIIEIKPDIISIGLDNGEIQEIRTSDINFVPHLGDEVEIFRSETKVIVNKVEKKNNENVKMGNSNNIPNGGININMNQNYGTIPPQTSYYTQPNYNPYTPNGKVVNKVTYVLLAMFLGGFGAHKFYAGKHGQGFLYLLFCWTYIPEAIGFIEGIIAIFKPADQYGNIVIS